MSFTEIANIAYTILFMLFAFTATGFLMAVFLHLIKNVMTPLGGIPLSRVDWVIAFSFMPALMLIIIGAEWLIQLIVR